MDCPRLAWVLISFGLFFTILFGLNIVLLVSHEYTQIISQSNNLHCPELPPHLSRFKVRDIVRQHQDKLLILLQVFHEFAEKYNIPYQLIDGTQLGAIRNHGLIPWDEDVDISIPNSYYNYTVQMLQKSIKQNFKDLDLSYNLSLNITHLSWLHGILKLYFSDNDAIVPGNPENRTYITWNWPFMDIFYPSTTYYKTDPMEWFKEYPKYSKEQPQSYFDIDEFYRNRYVFFYHDNIEIANKLIFKVHYKIRHYEQWRLNELVAIDFDHVNEYMYRNFNNTPEPIEKMKKYFNFVEYEYVNRTMEIEKLKRCNSDAILQTVVYIRSYRETEGNTYLCIEVAKRYRQNTVYSLESQFTMKNVDECLFTPNLI